MPSLNELKRKIRVIDSTKKITNAMKLVATSKLKKYKSMMLNSNDFCSNFYDVFSFVKNNIDTLKNDLKTPKTLWVIFSSSMGLCGSYNLNEIKELKQNYQPEDLILIVGRRGTPLVNSKINNPNYYFLLDAEDKQIDYSLMFELANKLLTDYYANQFSSIKIIFTHFVNSISFENKIFSVIPFDEEFFNRLDKPSNGGYYVIEPSQKDLFDASISLYFSVALFGSYLESKVCENGSRRNAMDAATKNADDLLNDYKIKFNSVRQAKITQEINEIVSGSKLGDSNE